MQISTGKTEQCRGHRRRGMPWLLAGLVVAALLLAGHAGARKRSSKKAKRARSARAQIEAARAEMKTLAGDLKKRQQAVKELDDKAKSITEAIGQLDESLAQLGKARKKTTELKTALEGEHGRLEARLQDEEVKNAALKKRVSRRMRAVYVLAGGGAARVLLGADSFEDLALRRHVLERLTKNDLVLLEDYDRSRSTLLARQAEVQTSREEVARTTKVLDEQEDLAQKARAARSEALKRIRTEKDLQKRQAKELKERRSALAKLLKNLTKKKSKKARKAQKKRRKRSRGGKGILANAPLPRPVSGKVFRRYGSTRDKESRAVLVSHGLHYRAKRGTSVKSIAAGRVAFTGWMRGFGRIVIVDHGEGHHSLLAHLASAKVKTGQKVKSGQIVGTVGDTESPDGVKLYFELRDHGKPVDPWRWMSR